MIGDLCMLPEGALWGAGKDVAEIQHASKPIIEIGTSASSVPISPAVTPKWTPTPSIPTWYSDGRKAKLLQNEVRIPSASVPNSPLRTIAKPGASTPARNPDLPDKKYWLPYKLKNTNRFEEVDRLQPTGVRKLMNKFLFSDRKALSLFKESYPKISGQQGKVDIVQEALDYLFKRDKISDGELNAWTKKLIQIGTQDRRIISEFHSSLFYGLHTLRLKYYNNVQLTQALAQAMKSFTSEFRQSASTPLEKG
ncbi:hypothetical protein PGT21_026467 [Puccinia graminis f. sp. tritici]|uniref:Uncharacterized protein n=1 Tax=Puccinia graminis f. sp. tritici TaxID=56615 RepID=A0A5B0PAF0_PUCGR|nr:hypothetical protein PGT21_026467 [Puccinia graminis f. sp. tritici]KAA1117029.1 hypothetical protein PGTUg99_034382 [Puccinia graminis f. sp. tritici]